MVSIVINVRDQENVLRVKIAATASIAPKKAARVEFAPNQAAPLPQRKKNANEISFFCISLLLSDGVSVCHFDH